MRLIGFTRDRQRHVGAVTGGEVIPLGDADTFYADPRAAMMKRIGTVRNPVVSRS